MISNTRNRAFFHAARHSNIMLLQQILNEGLAFNVDATSTESPYVSALTLAVSHMALSHTSSAQRCIKLLLEAGANPLSNHGSALTKAASLNCTECLSQLLVRVGQVNNVCGDAALTAAMQSNSISSARLLVQHGANPDVAHLTVQFDDPPLAYHLARVLSRDRQTFLDCWNEVKARVRAQLSTLLLEGGVVEPALCSLVLLYASHHDLTGATWRCEHSRRRTRENSTQSSTCCIVC
jgi:hypothetical protein